MGLVRDISQTISTALGGNDVPREELKTWFRQGYVFEIKEDDKTVDTFVLVVNPRNYTVSSPFVNVLTPAEDNTVVAEENGVIIREISLEGTFGVTAKRVQKGFKTSQGSKDMTGTQHFTKLRDFFEKYSLRKKDPTVAHKTKMVFHALRDDKHYVVVPRSFDVPRDAGSTRVHYAYRIALAAIADADKLASFKPPDDKEGGFFGALRDINDAVNDARAAIADATARISEFKRKIGNIQVVLNNIGQLVNAASGFVAASTSFINIPVSLAAAAVSTLSDAADTMAKGATAGGFDLARKLQRLEAASDQLMMFPERFKDTKNELNRLFDGEKRLTAGDISRKEAGAVPGSDTRNRKGGGARHGGLDLDFKNGFVSVVVERTDSLESIANRYSAQKETIIVINDLRFPYIALGGGPGVAGPGDRILVPADVPPVQESSPGSDYLSPEDVLYGIDLQIDQDHFEKTGLLDLAVNETADSDDGELSRGVANVLQGTRITVTTERGGTVFLPEIGISNSVGTKGTAEAALLAAVNLRSAILSDPRIDYLASSKIVLDGDELTQEVTPILKGGAQGPALVLSFGKATG